MIISNILGIIVFTSYLTFLHLVISLLSLFFFFCTKQSGIFAPLFLASVLPPGSVCLPFFCREVCSSGMRLETGQHASFGGWGLGSFPGTLSRGWVEGHRPVLLCARDTQRARAWSQLPRACCVTSGNSLDLCADVPTGPKTGVLLLAHCAA